MATYVKEVVSALGKGGETVVLMMDQSQIVEGLQCLMISLRFKDRALPVAWQVKETEGTIGWESQKALLDEVLTMIPAGASILLSADRFYGTSSLIGWCQSHQWDYRI
jgi:3-deoxy-D-arabino-heptulosonate 7-phosphate (DAHP) synthase